MSDPTVRITPTELSGLADRMVTLVPRLQAVSGTHVAGVDPAALAHGHLVDELNGFLQDWSWGCQQLEDSLMGLVTVLREAARSFAELDQGLAAVQSPSAPASVAAGPPARALIEGNPAPGDVERVRLSAGTLQSLSNDLADVIAAVRRDTESCGPERWSGAAGDAFRDRADKLPPELGKARDSFGQAALGLARYADTLATDQDEARRTVGQAESAQADRNAAQSRLADLAVQRRMVRGGQLRIVANLAQLALWKRGSLVTGDVAAVQDYQRQELVQRADQRRLDADAAALDGEIRRENDRLARAEAALVAARRSAQAIRERQRSAGVALVGALRSAHEAGINQSLRDKIGGWISDYGPVVQEVLSTGALVCQLLAFIPVLTPVMAPLAVGLGVAAGVVGLAVHLQKYADGGYPKGAAGLAHFGIDLAGDALAVLPAAKGVVGAATKGTKAAGAATKVVGAVDAAQPWVSFVVAEADAVFDAVEDGESIPAAMVWVAAEQGAGPALRHGISGASRHAGTAEALRDVSRSYGRSPAPADDLVVSLGMSGQQKAGQFSFGGTRILSTGDIDEKVGALVGGVHEVVDRVSDRASGDEP